MTDYRPLRALLTGRVEPPKPKAKPSKLKKRKSPASEREAPEIGVRKIDSGAPLGRWKGWRTRGPNGPVIVKRIGDDD